MAVLRVLDAVTLKRDRLVAALAHLDHALAAVVVDDAFHEYAEAVGRAREQLLATYFVDEGGVVRSSTKPNAELLDIAETFGRALREATEKLVKDLGVAGAAAEISPAQIEADVLRGVAASALQGALEGSFDPGHPGYDALRGFAEARRRDPLIAGAAERAKSDPAVVASLGAAVASYREQARTLGTRCLARAGRLSFGTLVTEDPSRPPMPEFDKLREEYAADQREWRSINNDLADAIEQYLRSAGDEAPAAAWRLQFYAVAATRAVPSVSWAQMVIDSAGAAGVSDEEMKGMRDVMLASLPERAARAKAVVHEYERWEAQARAAKKPVMMTAPTDALLTADDKRAATDKAVRDRVLACVRSGLVKSDLDAVKVPAGAGQPMWRQIADERVRRANQATSKESQP